MSEIILDSVIDSIKLLPFLFLTYLFMEWMEHIQPFCRTCDHSGNFDRGVSVYFR